MDQQLVIKLSEQNKEPIGLVESPPILYTNFKQLFPKVAFSEIADSSEVEPYGYGVFQWAYPPKDLSYTRSCDSLGITRHSDGVWRDTFLERPATAEEINERTALKAESVRAIRNERLLFTDYTQLPDASLSEAKVVEFVQYRQRLRDITKLAGFPWEVEFPVAPDN